MGVSLLLLLFRGETKVNSCLLTVTGSLTKKTCLNSETSKREEIYIMVPNFLNLGSSNALATMRQFSCLLGPMKHLFMSDVESDL